MSMGVESSPTQGDLVAASILDAKGVQDLHLLHVELK